MINLNSVQNLMLSVAVLRNKFMKKTKDSLLDEYKYQITKEEFLDFTPTPKKDEKGLDDFNSFSQNVMYNACKLKPNKTKKVIKKIKNQSKLFSHPNMMIKTKPQSLYPSKPNTRFLK